MKDKRDHFDHSTPATMAGAFSLPGLVSVIGYRLTAYIGSTSAQGVVDWLRNGLPVDIEPRLKAAFDVANPIAEVESELVAQGFLIRKWDETGPYETPARMLREADVETARSILKRVAAAEFLSNEVPNLADVAGRLQEWINHAELPECVGYSCRLWHSRRLSLVLVHTGFLEEVQRKWDRGIDWPCWTQVIAAAPEMDSARLNIDLSTGCPFRYLRSSRVLRTTESNTSAEA